MYLFTLTIPVGSAESSMIQCWLESLMIQTYFKENLLIHSMHRTNTVGRTYNIKDFSVDLWIRTSETKHGRCKQQTDNFTLPASFTRKNRLFACMKNLVQANHMILKMLFLVRTNEGHKIMQSSPYKMQSARKSGENDSSNVYVPTERQYFYQQVKYGTRKFYGTKFIERISFNDAVKIIF